MICEELEKEITSETCTAMKKHNWCDRSCEQKPIPKNGNGGNVKSPQNNPIAVDQPSQISTITPELAQSTVEEAKTITGHSEKAKADIMGVCGKMGDELTWGACRQRKYKRHPPDACFACDPLKEFQFSEPPKGRGWTNSAARVGDRECPELDGRKLKKSTCLMRAGKKRKAGQECIRTCQYWKGEKIVIRCIECGDKEVNNIGDLCPDCHLQRGKVQQQKIDEMGKYGQVKMWCPTCEREKMGALHCGECDAELQVRQPTEDAMAYSERRELHRPITYLCPNCAKPVNAKDTLCETCQSDGWEMVEKQKYPSQPDNDYDRQILSTEPVKPNHVKLVGISAHILDLLARQSQLISEIESLDAIATQQRNEIVAELQKAVKGSAIQGIQIDAGTGNVGIGH